jgi:hypothetical protein
VRTKSFIIASLVTLGAIPILIWSWRKVRYIELSPLSDEWLCNANLVEVDPFLY